MGMVIEECAELIKALQKFKRTSARSDGVSIEACDNVAEEVADVEIMCSQMRVLFGDDIVKEIKIVKLHGLRKLLDKESKEAEAEEAT